MALRLDGPRPPHDGTRRLELRRVSTVKIGSEWVFWSRDAASRVLLRAFRMSSRPAFATVPRRAIAHDKIGLQEVLPDGSGGARDWKRIRLKRALGAGRPHTVKAHGIVCAAEGQRRSERALGTKQSPIEKSFKLVPHIGKRTPHARHAVSGAESPWNSVLLCRVTGDRGGFRRRGRSYSSSEDAPP